MRLLRTPVLVAVVVSLFIPVASPASAGAPTDPTIVGTDPAGDWGDQPLLAPIGDALGQDIIEASIAKPDPQSLRFIMTFTNLPDSDPTVTGLYLWPFETPRGHRTLVSCGWVGGPDCEDPDNFAVLGDCEYQDHPVLGDEMQELDCEQLGEAAAEIDRASNSISVTVPLQMIKARPGQLLKMKDRWVVAASPALLMVAYGDSSGNNWGTYLNFDILEVERNYRIPR